MGSRVDCGMGHSIASEAIEVNGFQPSPNMNCSPMKKYFAPGLITAIALYAPFLAIVRDPFSQWWSWFAIPGWPLQIFHGNDTFAIIGGTIISIAAIGAITIFAAKNRKRLFVCLIFAVTYSVLSAVFIQYMIHAG